MSSPVNHSLVDRLEPSSLNNNSSPSDSWQVQLSTSVSTIPSGGPSVKFAPLPQPAPWKRRSNVPLGVANRAQLMRRRPVSQKQYRIGDGGGNGIGQGLSPRTDRNRLQSEVEDSFVALGKAVKGVWHRVAKKSRRRGVPVAKNSADDERRYDAIVDIGRDEDHMGQMDLGEEEEGAWEEEEEDEEDKKKEGVQVQFREDISQTETVRDSNSYSWRQVDT